MLFKDANPILVEIAKMLAEPKEGYPEDFLIHVAHTIREKKMDIDDVSSKLPSPQIICDDISLLGDISKRSRCFWGCIPISYQYFDGYLVDESLDGYYETPSYIANGKKTDAPFTKTQFIESIEKRKGLAKKLIIERKK